MKNYIECISNFTFSAISHQNLIGESSSFFIICSCINSLWFQFSRQLLWFQLLCLVGVHMKVCVSVLDASKMLIRCTKDVGVSNCCERRLSDCMWLRLTLPCTPEMFYRIPTLQSRQRVFLVPAHSYSMDFCTILEIVVAVEI